VDGEKRSFFIVYIHCACRNLTRCCAFSTSSENKFLQHNTPISFVPPTTQLFIQHLTGVSASKLRLKESITMSDEASSNPSEDAQITFKVKTSSDGNHTITMPETATVLELKTKLAGQDYENIPADRQRLIYSGRVLKNEEPLSTYKIKPNNTIHMVKSALSNTVQKNANAGASSTGSSPAVPSNMAAGTANNPLAALTGARYAGHLNLPDRNMFGADSGVSIRSRLRLYVEANSRKMGAPPSEEQMADMLSDPATAQMMNEALDNPQMIEYMIQSNPTLREFPQAREVLRSPMFRQMMTNPTILRQAAQMRRMMNGGGSSSFPAPGVTDTTPAGAPGSTPTPNQPSQSPLFPFAMLGGTPNSGGADLNPFAALFSPSTFGAPGNTSTQSAPSPAPATQASPGTNAQGDASNPSNPANPPANPFAALFGPGVGTGAGAPTGALAGAPTNANTFGLPPVTPEMMQQAMAFLNGSGGSQIGLGPFGSATGSTPPPPDNRPPEERYAEQLRQLNEMGFFDFERNVEALRRSGGSVQGAIEQLLS
jgi:ubiquilin